MGEMKYTIKDFLHRLKEFRLACCPNCTNVFSTETFSPSYNDLKAKHEKVLEMLSIAESALQKIAGPKKKDGTYFYSISQIQKMEMYDCGADNENARVALDKIERLKK